MPYKVIPTNIYSGFRGSCKMPPANRQLPTVIRQLDIYPILTLYIFSWLLVVDCWWLVFSRTSNTTVQWCEHVYIHNTPKKIVMTLFFLLARSEYCSNGYSYFRWLLLLILWDTGVMRNNYTTLRDTKHTCVNLNIRRKVLSRLLHFKTYQLFNLVWLKVWLNIINLPILVLADENLAENWWPLVYPAVHSSTCMDTSWT